MRRYIIGIDPDIKESGVAILDTLTRELTLSCKPFEEMVPFFQSWRGKDVVVVMEAGWLNKKASWHLCPRDSRESAAHKGKYVGRNNQIGIDLVSLCKAYGVEVEERKPFVKCWSGPDRKITHEEFVYCTGIKDGRTNQEKRDAGLMAWYYAGLPIKAKVIKGK